MKTIILLLLTVTWAVADPNPKLTPGITTGANTTTICQTQWGLDIRHVTTKMKQTVFAMYGIPWANHRLYEVDHLIPRELGGADDVRNLWPQPWIEAHQKDLIENLLHKRVCNKQTTLVQAQHDILNWRSVK